MKSKISYAKIKDTPVFAPECGKLFRTPKDAVSWLLSKGYADAEVQHITVAIKYNIKFFDSYWRIASKEDLESHAFAFTLAGIPKVTKIIEPKWICLETGNTFNTASDCVRWLTAGGCKNVSSGHKQHLGIRPLAGLNFEMIQPGKKYVPTNPKAKPLENALEKKVKPSVSYRLDGTSFDFKSKGDAAKWFKANLKKVEA